MSEQPEGSSSRRPTIAVATVGHHRHGKTTLTSAITRVLAARPGAEASARSVAELDRQGGSPPVELVDGRLSPRPGLVPGPAQSLTIQPTSVRYATERRAFVHIDSPGRRPWLKNAARAQALVDALIVVVSAVDSVQPQTHEHLVLARALGISQLVVFLNKCDAVQDGEWIDLVERDIRELLGRCGFDGDATRIVRGAALPASLGDPDWETPIVDLVAALEEDVTAPPRDRDGAPLMYLHHVFARRVHTAGLLVEGRVRRGTLRRGTPLTLLGGAAVAGEALTIKDIEKQYRKVERAEAGDLVGLLLASASRELTHRHASSGTALLAPGARETARVTARIELLAPDDGGRPGGVRDNHSALFLFGTAVMSGRIRLPQGQPLAPGGSAVVELELRAPVYLEPGMRFAIRDGNQGAWTRGAPARWAGLSGAGEVLAASPNITT